MCTQSYVPLTDSARLRGTLSDDGVFRCFNIPYATAEYRQPAQPAPLHDHDGTTRPSAPPDNPMVLSVCAPLHRKNLPIMVWLHGGRYEEGHPSEPWADPGKLAHDGVLTISLGYRKRFSGFWPWREGHGIEQFPALQDLQLALQWIRTHAPTFGGDISNVTVVGQSAGAGIALLLASDPRHADMIQRAVAMSPAFSWAAYNRQYPLSPRRLALGLPLALARKPMPRLYQFAAQFCPSDTLVGPRISNYQPRVPVLVTTTSEEFHFAAEVKAVERLPKIIASAYTAFRRLRRSPGERWSILPTGLSQQSFGDAVSDATIRRHAIAIDYLHRQANIPVWTMEFRPGEGEGIGPDGLPTSGAPHCIDIRRLFGLEAHHPFYEVVRQFLDGNQKLPNNQVFYGAGAKATTEIDPQLWDEVRQRFRSSLPLGTAGRPPATSGS